MTRALAVLLLVVVCGCGGDSCPRGATVSKPRVAAPVKRTLAQPSPSPEGSPVSCPTPTEACLECHP